MFMFLFLFFSMLLLSSFLRLKELLQVKNGVSTSLLFFLKMPKIWVGRTTVKGEKKRGWPYYYYLGLSLLLQEKVTFMDTKKIG